MKVRKINIEAIFKYARTGKITPQGFSFPVPFVSFKNVDIEISKNELMIKYDTGILWIKQAKIKQLTIGV